ncbi:glycosyltransferase family 25 protein [Seminibacterium arietis]|uniref:Glycosyltransferase family 25 protein n=1 Tax=Seminibacterium arietis TaxID=1173502 RepID=A0ABW3I8A2_9PAST
MFNHVISLETAIDRRLHIEKEFKEQNIPFTFSNAFQPNEANDNIILNLVPNLNKTELTNGEKGCLISHLLLWKKCIDDNLPFISIFEDDILLSNEAHFFIKNYDWLKERFKLENNFIIRLETFLMEVEEDRNTLIKTFKNRKFNQLKSSHWGTAGYIISQPMAKNLLAQFKKMTVNDIHPIDQIIFNQLLSDNQYQIYQLNPAILIQELTLYKEKSHLKSDIEPDRRKIMNSKKIKRNLWQKIKREIWRYKIRKQEKLIKKQKEYQIVKFL